MGGCGRGGGEGKLRYRGTNKSDVFIVRVRLDKTVAYKVFYMV